MTALDFLTEPSAFDEYLHADHGEPRTAGGSGSGNFSHAGRPGEVGGSGAGTTDHWSTADDAAVAKQKSAIKDVIGGGQVHVDHSPIALRAGAVVESTLKELKDKGYKMPTNVKVELLDSPTISGGTEHYRGEHTLSVELPKNLPENADLDRAVRVAFPPSEDQYAETSVTNMKEVVLHEMGYVISYPVRGVSDTFIAQFGTGEVRAMRLERAANSVSHYAATRKEDFVAEAFVRKYCGESLSADAELLYKELHGPVIR